MNARCHFPFSLLMVVTAIMQPIYGANAAQVVSAGSQGRVVPNAFFGMHVRYATTRTPWPDVDFFSWRVITPETEWRGLQPNGKEWNFGSLDRAVDLAKQNDVEVFLTLGQTPRWAASRPDEKVSNGPGASSEPTNIEDWEKYVRTIARRYKGRIKYYELWNEPRFREVDPYRVLPGFTGYARQMVELGRVAKRVLTEEDPLAALVSPGFDAGFVGLPRVDQWFKAGGGEVTSVLGYHFYLRPPERMAKLYSDLRAIATRYGFGGMPIWNTESGYFVVNPEQSVKPQYSGTDYVFARVLTPEENAAYMVRAHLICAAAGLDRFYWYSWDIRDMGLTRSFGKVQTAGSVAYGTMLRWMRGSRIRRCSTDDDKVWMCELQRNGTTAYVVWNVSGDSTYSVPQPVRDGQMESIDGQAAPVLGSSIHIGISPLLLRPKGSVWLP